jgi:dCTP deaminase
MGWVRDIIFRMSGGMTLLTKDELWDSIRSADPNSIFIDPLLDEGQVDNVTVDFRLGYDFLVSILTRKPSIDLGAKADDQKRSILSYFQESRRELGDKFVLYPNQVVITNTLEYLSLPSNIYADVLSRSSITRLGIHINTMMQPGFRGCVPLELFNHGNSPVEVVVGSRICQLRFFRVSNKRDYLDDDGPRKYYVDVRPTVSKADQDKELARLVSLREKNRQ